MKYYGHRTFKKCNFFFLIAAIATVICLYMVTLQVAVAPVTINFISPEILKIQQTNLTTCCVTNANNDKCNRKGCKPCFFKNMQFDSVEPSNQVFFHETSGKESLDFRQACAVESVARNDPSLIINVLMTGNVNGTTPSMQALLQYPNVRILHIDLGRYFLGTPLDGWYFCTNWNRGKYAVSHLSDALRFLTLYKFGGYYLDLDFVVLKSIASYRNFVGAESDLWLAAGALHVDYQHPVIKNAVEEFRTTYKRNEWGYNGPELLTRVLVNQCHASNVSDLLDSHGDCNFQVLPPKTFYPLHYRNWTLYFDSESDILNAETFSNDSAVIGAHVWNKFSASVPLRKNSEQFYSRLAKRFCPNTYTAAPDIF